MRTITDNIFPPAYPCFRLGALPSMAAHCSARRIRRLGRYTPAPAASFN